MLKVQLDKVCFSQVIQVHNLRGLVILTGPLIHKQDILWPFIVCSLNHLLCAGIQRSNLSFLDHHPKQNTTLTTITCKIQ